MIINRNYTDEMKGHPQTKQRRLLLELIREADGLVDAKELYRRASSKDNSISTATVYRSLNLFKELGIVNEKRLGQACCYFEISGSTQHQHLVCADCGKVVDFDCPLGEVVEKVQNERGFKVTKAELYLEGCCSECTAEMAKKKNPDDPTG